MSSRLPRGAGDVPEAEAKAATSPRSLPASPFPIPGLRAVPVDFTRARDTLAVIVIEAISSMISHP